jgi:hypothetical protein
MTIKRVNKILWRIVLASAVLSPVALADVYDLTLDDCSGGCGTAPFGTVTVVQGTSSSIVDINVTLASGESFANTGAGAALGFNISGDPSVTLGDFTTGFGVGPTMAHLDGTGTFDYTAVCTGCGNGGSPPNLSGPLNFTVTVGSGTLAPSDFVANDLGNFFSVDILGTTGNTGDVASTGPSSPSVTPEPGAVVLYGTGLIAFGALLRRRNHRAPKGA